MPTLCPIYGMLHHYHRLHCNNTPDHRAYCTVCKCSGGNLRFDLDPPIIGSFTLDVVVGSKTRKTDQSEEFDVIVFGQQVSYTAG